MLLPLLLAAASPAPVPTPTEIVAAAPATDWQRIAPADLVVMDLAADRDGKPRRVVIQLIPAPFSQGWVANIRKLVAARWYDGVSINRVQDNYVVQWGPNGEDKAKAKALPVGLVKPVSPQYATPLTEKQVGQWSDITAAIIAERRKHTPNDAPYSDSYATFTGFISHVPVAIEPSPGLITASGWPVHCYGMVGVGRDMPPDTGTGAELYTVIGHAPRHLDRNIALVGRVIEGIEHLSSLPRGTGALGFYEQPEERVGITSVRMGNEVAGLPAYEYLSTESAAFARYADARANRRDAFFVTPAGGADICNIPVPTRRSAP